MLDARFPTYAAGSRRLYAFLEAGEQALLTAEVRRSLPPLVHAADNRVAKGQLTAAQADAIGATWRAIAADLEAWDDWLGRAGRALECLRPRQSLLARLDQLDAANRVAWQAKVEALRGEIDARRTAYPALVAKGQLTADQARQQLERLEAVHDLYWRKGFAFDGTRDELRAISDAVLDFDVEQQGAATVAPRQEQAA